MRTTTQMPPHGKTSPYPRCRWCHEQIMPSTGEELAEFENHGIAPRAWYHVSTENEQCVGRTNKAEPMPALQEEPFIASVYLFVDQHRKLRRAFREVSQSRASALRRLNDYHELVDKLIAALEHDTRDADGRSALVIAAARELSVYRRSTISAGWR